MDCIFCKIVAGDIPAYKIYENDKIISFLDINPINKGHALVIPKEHHVSLSDTEDSLLCEIITVAKRLAPAIVKAVGLTDYKLISNSGKDAGQVVFHTHFHIIPRFAGDGFGKVRLGKYKKGEAEEIIRKIKELL